MWNLPRSCRFGSVTSDEPQLRYERPTVKSSAWHYSFSTSPVCMASRQHSIEYAIVAAVVFLLVSIAYFGRVGQGNWKSHTV